MNKLLSICIPTYNRAEILDETLNKLFSNPEFDNNLIEVIVSDNCSTDNTNEVVLKYPLVRYYRNNKNIRDYNYSIVLGYATGEYIRLFNDTLSFKGGILKTMLSRIQQHLKHDCNLFFYRNMFQFSNCKKVIYSKEAYLKTVSFYSTSIANFGIWKKDFQIIENKDRHAELQFVQVDWSYQLLKNKKETIIYFDDLFNVAELNKKGGYNVFNTFINNYLFILKQKKIPLLRYEVEKYRLCKHFVYMWLITLFVTNKQNFSFDTNGVYKIIFKKYWYEPYLYPLLILFLFKKLRR
jgi:glycosyltransferase involved in cell wall biosynthesis